MIRDKETIMQIRNDALNDPQIAFYHKQKAVIMLLATPFIIMDEKCSQILKQGIDDRSQKEIDKIDLLIEARLNQYRDMLD